MFKAATLICRKPNGKLVSVVSDSLDPLLAQAKEARASGLLDGVQVAEGVVLANWRRDPAYVFRAEKPESEEDKKAKAKAEKAKAKAEKADAVEVK